MRSRVIILTGAGLSKDANLPTSVELAQKVKATLQEMSAGAFSSGPALPTKAKRWLGAFRFLSAAIRFQEALLDRDPDTPVNIEQLAIAAEELQHRTLNPLAPYTSGWHTRVIELEKQDPEILLGFTEFIYSKLEKWLTFEDENVVSYMARIADICNQAKAPYPIDIFTLNYDLCLETALQKFAGKVFVNGFTAQGTWDPTLFDADSDVRLFKLHGSLDWIDDSVYGICSLTHPKHERAETLKGEEWKALLIFGTAHKLSAREPFFTLAYHFSQQVLRSPLLVVVGYSFGDDYVNQIIEQGIRRNQKLRVLIASPRATELIERNQFLKGYPRVSPLNLPGKEALNGGQLLTRMRELLEEGSTEEPFK